MEMWLCIDFGSVYSVKLWYRGVSMYQYKKCLCVYFVNVGKNYVLKYYVKISSMNRVCCCQLIDIVFILINMY